MSSVSATPKSAVAGICERAHGTTGRLAMTFKHKTLVQVDMARPALRSWMCGRRCAKPHHSQTSKDDMTEICGRLWTRLQDRPNYPSTGPPFGVGHLLSTKFTSRDSRLAINVNVQSLCFWNVFSMTRLDLA